MMSGGGTFSIVSLTSSFASQDTASPGSIHVGHFLTSMRSVSSLFSLLGRGFSFVKDDVDAKVSSIESLGSVFDPGRFGKERGDRKCGKEEDGDNWISPSGLGSKDTGDGVPSGLGSKDTGDGVVRFETVREMLVAEKEGGVLESGKGNPCGARSLQRLWRALDFIVAFVDLVEKSSGESAKNSVKPEMKKAYADTLSRHHAWAIRQLVSVAAMALPSRSDFCKVLLGSDAKDGATVDEINAQAYEEMKKLVAAVRPVRDSIINCYEELEIGDLP